MHKLYTHQKSQACFLRPVNEDSYIIHYLCLVCHRSYKSGCTPKSWKLYPAWCLHKPVIWSALCQEICQCLIKNVCSRLLGAGAGGGGAVLVTNTHDKQRNLLSSSRDQQLNSWCFAPSNKHGCLVKEMKPICTVQFQESVFAGKRYWWCFKPHYTG
jgi:hypothetical protein